ncbi:MAG: hypothetical protein LBM98_04450 [Oscillospiraceae bacterium]|nr:hypothetical protein [Oscillospiraceae bacterium]
MLQLTVSKYQISETGVWTGLRPTSASRRRARGQGRSPARHCEAPVSPRYVGRYRCEAIQCRGDNIRLTSCVLRLTSYVSYNSTSTVDCFAAFHRYVSQVRWRLRNDGRGKPRPYKLQVFIHAPG